MFDILFLNLLFYFDIILLPKFLLFRHCHRLGHALRSVCGFVRFDLYILLLADEIRSLVDLVTCRERISLLIIDDFLPLLHFYDMICGTFRMLLHDLSDLRLNMKLDRIPFVQLLRLLLAGHDFDSLLHQLGSIQNLNVFL